MGCRPRRSIATLPRTAVAAHRRAPPASSGTARGSGRTPHARRAWRPPAACVLLRLRPRFPLRTCTRRSARLSGGRH
ncbi:hypothetical protein DEI89_06785 [Curtobacterium sp. MCBD17_030]|nr:hypothetical protein DEI89_06785 [Curtobacterium sp. MCBD17_030]